MYRPPIPQSIHDRVIRAVASAQITFEVLTNPGHEHNWSVAIGQERVFPDLLLCAGRERQVTHLIEVETVESVSDEESSQWRAYASGPGTFWLLVPAESLGAARAICLRRGIPANFGLWWLEHGEVRFTFN